jgi:hypothetical protein
MAEAKPWLNNIATTVQVGSVVAGVVISILSFNAAREKEADARKLEAAKPFLTLRQGLYTEAVKAAATLVNQSTHTAEEIQAAGKRFRDLYVAELSMVEAPNVEEKMAALAMEIDRELVPLQGARLAAYQLAHALRDSFVAEWQLPPEGKLPASPKPNVEKK